MVFSNIGYSLREAGHHFRRNWSTSFGAVVTIFLSLFIIGTFVISSAMLTSIVGDVEDRVTIQAFLSDDADRAAVDAVQADIESWDNVESVTYKSKEQALQEYRETMTNRNASDAVAALDGENPVPASLVIKLDDPQLVESVATRLIEDPDFAAVCDDPNNVSSSVQYGRETVERLFQVTNYIRIAAVVLVALLSFVAFVFINNTIRLAIAARRREIAIEKLVGASNSFIRGPFVMEGMIEALLGAILAIVSLQLAMSFIVPTLENSLKFLSFEVPTTVIL
ncbi:MAG: ABC transporter permease, partial [Atopobiaceae bacterium]|nr:ABC transporter permease [Atopobiaceae bacterium]